MLKKLTERGPVSFSLSKPDLDAINAHADRKSAFIPPLPTMEPSEGSDEQKRISELLARLDPKALENVLRIKEPPSDKSVRNF